MNDKQETVVISLESYTSCGEYYYDIALYNFIL